MSFICSSWLSIRVCKSQSFVDVYNTHMSDVEVFSTQDNGLTLFSVSGVYEAPTHHCNIPGVSSVEQLCTSLL